MKIRRNTNENEKYLHENIVPDSEGFDDFMKYRGQSFLESSKLEKNRSIIGRNDNSSLLSSNSFADQIAMQKHLQESRKKKVNTKVLERNAIIKSVANRKNKTVENLQYTSFDYEKQ